MTMKKKNMTNYTIQNIMEIKNGQKIINRRYLHSPLVNNSNINGICPSYISGLTQTDGCFSCGTIINKNRTRIYFAPNFNIKLDLDSKQALERIQEYFGCGKITERLDEHTSVYMVDKLDDLMNKIFPHFEKHRVFYNKHHAFNLLVKIAKLLTVKSEYRDNISILRMAVSMNAASRRTDKAIKEMFKILGETKDFSKIPNTLTEENVKITPGFIAGIIDGDGSVNISFTNKGEIRPALSICIGIDWLPLLPQIRQYVGSSGALYAAGKGKVVKVLKITKLDDLVNKVIPFLDTYAMHTQKTGYYEIWKKVCLILHFNNKKLTKEQVLEIIELAYNMNRNGKRRKLTKEAYIELINKLYDSK